MARKAIGFYTRGRGRRRKVHPITSGRRRGTIFFPPRHKEAAEKIRIDSVPAARQSVRWLEHEWRTAKTDDKRRRLKAYAVLAANRARVISRNSRVSEHERREAARVAAVYERWYSSKQV